MDEQLTGVIEPSEPGDPKARSTVFMPAYQDASNDWWRQRWLPFYGIFMVLCGLAAGVVGSIAFIRKHERSWLVWLTILPGAFVFLLGEFLVPH